LPTPTLASFIITALSPVFVVYLKGARYGNRTANSLTMPFFFPAARFL
jgi:hypothetical protein